MRLQRLGWAGIEIEAEDETLVIDYIQDTAPLTPVLRTEHEPFPASSRPGRTAGALLTHLHADHADAGALGIALRPGAPVLRPEPASGSSDDLILVNVAEQKFARQTFKSEIVGPWIDRHIGPFRVASTAAVDGFGDPQISWVVEHAGRRVFHGGDTLFHGYWWRVVQKLGPIEVALLPINAAVCFWPHLQPPSPIGATMSPEQAAVAARILGAKTIIPIHYGSLNKAGAYVETPDPVERLEQSCREYGISVLPLQPGEWFELS